MYLTVPNTRKVKVTAAKTVFSCLYPRKLPTMVCYLKHAFLSTHKKILYFWLVVKPSIVIFFKDVTDFHFQSYFLKEFPVSIWNFMLYSDSFQNGFVFTYTFLVFSVVAFSCCHQLSSCFSGLRRRNVCFHKFQLFVSEPSSLPNTDSPVNMCCH